MITTPNAECILSAQYMSFSVSNRACYCSDDNTDTYQYLLTQTYPWVYPTVNCTPIIRTATGVTNLTCVTGCSTDGGYVTHPISTATDCISYSTSLGMLTSEQSVNTTLNETAYFWLAFQDCMEVQVNVPINFTLYTMNFCNKSKIIVIGLILPADIPDTQVSSLVNSTTNSSLAYVTPRWTPTTNQIEPQTFCAVAFTSEKVESNPYCATLIVTTSMLCVTTTTTSTNTSATSATTTTATTATTTTATTATTISITAATTTSTLLH
ncbi:unnamed protein product [Rotaria socialis]|uniref:Uncharacterized protein n=2 Tax=Rotaria socialis TaxID=392032 RepID=A0A818ACB5_9BILA|nr:unnamed protein product [Rotaria socialis]